MNEVQLIGNLGRDPEIINGSIAKFSLAVNEKRNGEDHTNWINIVAFGKTAELIEKYFHKGDKIAIVGKISTSQYEKNGETRYSTDVIANKIHFVGNKKQSDNSNNQSQDSGDNDDDVPF